jgi:hypothetical protein
MRWPDPCPDHGARSRASAENRTRNAVTQREMTRDEYAYGYWVRHSVQGERRACFLLLAPAASLGRLATPGNELQASRRPYAARLDVKLSRLSRGNR